MIKWIFIIVAVVATLSLNGCAKDATAEDSPTTTPTETQNEVRTNAASGEVIWIAIVMTWRPVNYTIDKEFASEVDCWNYYDNGVGESEMRSRYGTQVLDHQGNKPGKGFHFGTNENREYPTRLYHGINVEQGQVWLTCDIKGKYEGL
jgi:hypothetical protein